MATSSPRLTSESRTSNGPMTFSRRLHDIYKGPGGLFQLEKASSYNRAFHFELERMYYKVKPIILLLGEASTGKTAFVQCLLDGVDYPRSREDSRGPTKNVYVITHPDYLPRMGRNEVFPGEALIDLKNQQFHSLARRPEFLEGLKASAVDHEPLRRMTIVDTPGLISDDDDESSDDCTEFLQYFIERAGLILLFADPAKRSLSRELQRLIAILRPYREHVRIVVNKAESNENLEQRLRDRVERLIEGVVSLYAGDFVFERLSVSRELRRGETELFGELDQLRRGDRLRKLASLQIRLKTVSAHALLMSTLKKRLGLKTTFSAIFSSDKEEVFKRFLERALDDFYREHLSNTTLLALLPPLDVTHEMFLENFDYDSVAGVNFDEQFIGKVEQTVTEQLKALRNELQNGKFDAEETLRNSLYYQAPPEQELIQPMQPIADDDQQPREENTNY